MTLVDTIKSKDKRTSQERVAIEICAPKPNDLSSAKQILVRKGQHLDVDGILARSLPKPGAFSTKDVRTIVLPKPSEV